MGELDNLLRLIERFFGENARVVILFGSRARGEAREDSDYDVLIVVKYRTDEPLFWRELFRLEMEEETPYDVLIVSEDELTADNPILWSVLTGYTVLKGESEWKAILDSPRGKIKSKKPVFVEEGKVWNVAQLV